MTFNAGLTEQKQKIKVCVDFFEINEWFWLLPINTLKVVDVGWMNGRENTFFLYSHVAVLFSEYKQMVMEYKNEMLNNNGSSSNSALC